MPNVISKFGFLPLKGGTLSGDLTIDASLYMGLNPIVMLFDSAGGIIKGSGVIPGGIDVIAADQISDGTVKAGACTLSGDIEISAGKKVDGVDVSEIHQAKIKTGTYTGDGIDNRNIDIGVDLASKSNAYVIVKANNTNEACHRIEHAQGDLTMLYTALVDTANMIQAFTATGFQVGYGGTTNGDGTTYRYIAFWSE